MSPPRDSMLGMALGDYVIEERIGVGGMGMVYRAVQPLIGKQVAIKVLSPHLAWHPEEVRRLLAEARMVNAIRHRGIIDIFSLGQLPDGRQYVVMEYLHGTPLDAYLQKRGRLELTEALPLLDEVLAALGAAHDAGVIHRDIKPSNVFLVEQPDGTRYVKLLDFGIAKAEAPHPDTPRTLTGQMVGTPQYMAPEQVRGETVSPRTDLYAMGVLAFKMLTGRLPFSGLPHQVLLAQVEQEPPVPSMLVPELPCEADGVLLSLLAKHPGHRPGSAEEVRRMLAALWVHTGPTPSEPASSCPPTMTAPALTPAPTQPGTRPAFATTPGPSSSRRKDTARPRGRPWGWAAAVSGWLGLVGLLLGTYGRAPRQPGPEARTEAPRPLMTPRPEPGSAMTPRAAPESTTPRAEPGSATTLRAEPGSTTTLRAPPESTTPPSTEKPRPTLAPPTAPVTPALQPSPKRKRAKETSAGPHRTPPPARAERRTLSAPTLAERISRLEQAYESGVREGAKPHPLARAFLDRARKDAEGARTGEALRALDSYLDDWERRFLREPVPSPRVGTRVP